MCEVCATGDVEGYRRRETTRLREVIGRFGVALQLVLGELARRSPGFGYTIGLTEVDHPELLLFSEDPAAAADALNDLAADVLAGTPLDPGEVVWADRWPHRMLVEEVPNPRDIALAAARYYRRPSSRPGARPLRLLQLSSACDHGLLPGRDGYCRPGWLQPRPGEFSALR